MDVVFRIMWHPQKHDIASLKDVAILLPDMVNEKEITVHVSFSVSA